MNPFVQGFFDRAAVRGISQEDACVLFKNAAAAAGPAPAATQGSQAETQSQAGAEGGQAPAAKKQPMPSEQTTTRQTDDGAIEVKTIKKIVPGTPEYDQFIQQQGQQAAGAMPPPGAAAPMQ